MQYDLPSDRVASATGAGTVSQLLRSVPFDVVQAESIEMAGYALLAQRQGAINGGRRTGTRGKVLIATRQHDRQQRDRDQHAEQRDHQAAVAHAAQDEVQVRACERVQSALALDDDAFAVGARLEAALVHRRRLPVHRPAEDPLRLVSASSQRVRCAAVTNIRYESGFLSKGLHGQVEIHVFKSFVLNATGYLGNVAILIF